MQQFLGKIGNEPGLHMGILKLGDESEYGVLLIGGQTSLDVCKRIVKDKTMIGLAKDYHNAKPYYIMNRKYRFNFFL